MLLQLFLTFLKIGFVSFGGGYAVIPLIQFEVSEYGWLSNDEFQSTVALAGMAPGPIATNTATLIGFKTSGAAGAMAATAGIVLPSLLIIVTLATLFFRVRHNSLVRSSFYGLRPIVTGLIVYAALHFGFLGNGEVAVTWSSIGTLIICGLSLLLLIRYKLHPLLLILAAAAAGIVLF
ncbi:chromate transporter [Paenibacillus sp. F411]|uniref:Chromate transport protein n=1 Tax=Paenibacillus algicola TaxID=2565926 RepID=A0A4P8XKC3_9BACL|nr:MULTISPECIES: chromate transporter [Paenibacillus]MBO2943398.1 chromate transporter [Paenibacillus sp. F411]QCT02030.1 chromate transport protein [Paenibacillus algicola]